MMKNNPKYNGKKSQGDIALKEKENSRKNNYSFTEWKEKTNQEYNMV